jgi:hypothetical protein
MNWLNDATTWSRPGELSFVTKIGGSVTVTVVESEVTVSPLVVFDAVTVNVLTTDFFPL